MDEIRNNRTFKEIEEIYNTPLLELVYQAASVHRKHHHPCKINVNTLISVKTGFCGEDCAYCSQSSRYHTNIESHSLLNSNEVLKQARTAKDNGVPRVCLSASGKELSPGEFDKVIDMIHEIRKMGLKVCCTLGKVSSEQVQKLAKAGISAFNHNIDTSENYYKEIITTRTFKERIDTLNKLIDEGLPYCSGGIIGMGESADDRISMLHTLATMRKHPYTVPLNTLVAIQGTPLENLPKVPVWDMIRLTATARIVMPASIICLAAGRVDMNDEGQALCFMAGANSIFAGNKLLTTKNPDVEKDKNLLKKLGLSAFDTKENNQ